jgi:lipoprotein-anchoring transpeptidase ErfK/SrfK
MVALTRWFVARAGFAGVATVLLLTACSTSSPQTVSGARGNAQTVAAPGPVSISITPADGSHGVALDSPVVVSASDGLLLSVRLIEGGTATPAPGRYSADGRSWRSVGGLDSHANYSVFASAKGGGPVTSSHASFSTLAAQARLLTTVSPADGSVVGVGEPIDLRFDDSIPADRRAALLSRITVTSTPGVVGAWHWFTASDVHFRTADYWPSGTHVTVTADLKGFDVGDGTWGLGSWTSSFTVGAKHVSMIDDTTHTMNVYQNDQLIDTWPVSMGKAGFSTIEGTLIVLYRSYVVKMNSCTTFGGAACIPGSANYYNENVYYDTAISSDGYFIHSAPWSVYAQGHYDVSHGCVNLSPARAITFFNWSMSGDVVVISHTGNPASSADGEGDWQIPFGQFDNGGTGQVWTGPSRAADLNDRAV